MNLCLLCDKHDAMGGYLCPGCTKATVVRLECLPGLYDGLLPFLAPSTAVGQGRSGKGGPAPLPVVESILDLRGVMVGQLEDWLSAVRQERGMRGPRQGGVDGRLAGAVSGLLRNMPWIAVSWSQAGAFAEEIRDLARDVKSIVAPAVDEVRGTRVGNCQSVDVSGAICGAVLRLVPGDRVVHCDWCGMNWPPATWAQLKTWIDESPGLSHPPVIVSAP
ncbi:hypothetical protein [Streptomyces sp. NPDC060322]|uniref:hypothetical protein n=1 Tax=Streptomyces sp. NPDC060322 TaxID=3347097 RepID=UPI0036686617